jgi:acyl-CoA synthetase (AMP-forming)/AMP-acid ligase II
MAVLQRPLRWIEAISRFGAFCSGAPNFAYELCLQRIKPEQRDGLDLSDWKLAYVGAERVRPDTLEAFVEFFAPCGFRASSFLPCYGLAEATLLVTGDFGVTSVEVSPESLQEGKVANAERGMGLRLVGSGRPATGVDLRIVEPTSRWPLAEDRVGEVWVRGPQVAGGFWNNPTTTEEAFGARLADGRGPYLRTGDLGFLRDGRLFITGRIKDLIILDGRNHYPQDIEWSVQRSYPGLRPDSCAAFAVDGVDGERLVVVQEVERSYLRQGPDPIVHAIRRSVAEHHEIAVHDVRLVRPNAVPRTSSGKIQRSFCRGLYLEGKLDSTFETSRADSD